MSSLKERMAKVEGAGSRRSGAVARASLIPSVDIAESGDRSVLRTQRFREFDASRLRPWKYHNRHQFWLERDEQRALEASIRANGQHTLGLVRAVVGESDIDGEIVFGYRRAQACLAVGVSFRAGVVSADTPDTTCMQLMHSENAQSEDVSELENARVYGRLLVDGIYPTQTALAQSLGISQAYVSRLVAAASIYDHDWLMLVIEPLLPDVSVRMAAGLVSALQDPPTPKDDPCRSASNRGRAAAALGPGTDEERCLARGREHAQGGAERCCVSEAGTLLPCSNPMQKATSPCR